VTCLSSARCNPENSTRAPLNSCQALSGQRKRGMRLRMASEVLAAILRVIDAERQCCQFLRFQLTVEAGRGPVVLDLTGPPGTQEFLGAMIQSA
jgi:hypothetical protein